MSRPTLIEVAEQAGVSKSTASLALRGAPVSAEARERVQRAASQLGYIYDRAAAAMRGARSGTIGLIVFDLANPFYSELAAGVSESLEAEGALVLIADTREDCGRQSRILTRMREHRLDGLILCPSTGSDASELRAQIPSDLPLVQALRHVDGLISDYSGAENAAGTQAIGRHLLGLGHRRIAFAGHNDETSVQRERFAGLKQATDEAGLPPPISIACPPTLAGGVAAAETALALGPQPTALVCFNDLVAIGATLALAQRGMTPGRELSITGFDDIMEAALRTPALTTVAIEPRNLGRKAAELVLERLDDPNAPPKACLQPARLIVRNTTGAPSLPGHRHV
ncbi:LacI family transcriptional regulator [Bosea sp. LC85]|uniref:LacI family DNA-binding transcriptional regulator n=1 Tax=Bosea sp. LC85 TaxID=1502851 RepID=UPI0004E456CA|nr:LacI family DNA-binding transcriptional regulator [Bosea sp. LC85]KFC75645.1 LacI family transcriptional regulator [Bosea sp. LC85]